MPFKSKAQMRACFAKKDPKWNCREWAHETNMKSLPKKALRGGCLKCGGKMKKYQDGGENELIIIDPVTGQPIQQFGNQPNYNWTRTGQVPGNPNLPVDPALTTQIQESGDVNQFDVDPIKQKRNGNWVIKPDKQKVDPYFAIRGAVTGLSWLSGMAERKRQNQYMYNQLSTLGQRGTVPYQDYQPNPFSMYARFGGSLKKYQTGGPTYASAYGPKAQAMLDKKNLEAQIFEEKRGVPNASSVVVGRNINEPIVKYTGDIGRPPTQLATSLPFGITPDNVYQTNEGYFYVDNNSGAPVAVSPQAVFPAKATVAPIPPNSMASVTKRFKKGGNWIQKAVNPEHKGYCTPMTKATCTPRRKALARTFKKHHGFHGNK